MDCPPETSTVADDTKALIPKWNTSRPFVRGQACPCDGPTTQYDLVIGFDPNDRGVGVGCTALPLIASVVFNLSMLSGIVPSGVAVCIISTRKPKRPPPTKRQSRHGRLIRTAVLSDRIRWGSTGNLLLLVFAGSMLLTGT